MLNYLGPNVGPQGPIASQLPPATPGTMPQGVPGIPHSPAPLPNLPSRPPPMAPPVGGMHPAAHGPTLPSHHILAAILKHAASGGGHEMAPPPHPEYGTTTQSDGSILLHIKGPNGEMGPVVKVIPPIKNSNAGNAPPK